MSSITQTIPSYTGGISQQPDELKLPGQVSKAKNVYPDLVNGLTKRPGGKLIKSLSDGRGDRSGWIKSKSDVLILEGWFLGCTPVDFVEGELLEPYEISPPLSLEESLYRKRIQKSLYEYLPIWKKLSRVWHLKADSFSNTSTWKKQQEYEMLQKRGSSLQGKNLEEFIRMINTSIPQESLQSINSDIVLELNNKREIISLYVNKNTK